MEFSISSLLASLGHLFWSSLNYHQPVSVHYLPNWFCSTTSLIDLWFLKIPRVDIWNSNLKKIHLYSKIALLKQRKTFVKTKSSSMLLLAGRMTSIFTEFFPRLPNANVQKNQLRKCLSFTKILNKVESLSVNFFLLSKSYLLQFANVASKVNILAKLLPNSTDNFLNKGQFRTFIKKSQKNQNQKSWEISF